MEKQCTKCNKILPIEAFGINKANKDGYNHTCKSCKNAYAAIMRNKYREAINKRYVERYHSDPDFKKHRRETHKQAYRNMRKNNLQSIIYASVKARAKKSGIIFTITKDDIIIPKNVLF